MKRVLISPQRITVMEKTCEGCPHMLRDNDGSHDVRQLLVCNHQARWSTQNSRPAVGIWRTNGYASEYKPLPADCPLPPQDYYASLYPLHQLMSGMEMQVGDLKLHIRQQTDGKLLVVSNTQLQNTRSVVQRVLNEETAQELMKEQPMNAYASLMESKFEDTSEAYSAVVERCNRRLQLRYNIQMTDDFIEAALRLGSLSIFDSIGYSPSKQTFVAYYGGYWYEYAPSEDLPNVFNFKIMEVQI